MGSSRKAGELEEAAEMAEKDVMIVKVRSPLVTGTQTVRVARNGTIRQLKREIGRLFPRRRVQSFCNGAELKNNSDTLFKAGVRPNSTVTVLCKMASGLIGNLQRSQESEETLSDLPATPANSPANSPPLSKSSGLFAGVLPWLMDAEDPPTPRPAAPTLSPEAKAKEETEMRKAADARAHVIRLVMNKAEKKKNVVSVKKHKVTDSFSDGQLGSGGLTSPNWNVATPAPLVSASQPAVAASSSGGSGGACAKCDKGLGSLQRYECRCQLVFCNRHRQPERHACSFNYKAQGRDQIRRDNASPKSKGPPNL